MSVSPAGKWAWIWNWRRCDGGDASRVAARLRQAGCRGAFVKAHDGPRWFDQGRPWRDIAAALKAEGLLVGAWAYVYGRDPAGEARLAAETVSYGEADLFVLDAEAEFEGRAGAAEELCRLLRERVGWEYPLYYSTFAIAGYHRSFPYAVFERFCAGALPQVYWNAFRWPVAQALQRTYQDYASLGIEPGRIFPVAGLYRARGVAYPAPADVRAFAQEATRRGSPGVSFWSYEHASEEMWSAVRAWPATEIRTEIEEEEMSSLEFQQLSGAHAALAERVARLEKSLAAVKGKAPARSRRAPRTYTVRQGDTLSGIAARLGLSDWRTLYEANRKIVGPDPDLIRPGQVLTVPQ